MKSLDELVLTIVIINTCNNKRNLFHIWIKIADDQYG